MAITPSRQESGLALIMVLSLVAIIVTIISEILFQSEITSRSSIGERNKLQAEASALTGFALAKMLVTLSSGVDSLVEELSKPNSPKLAALPASLRPMIQAQIGGVKKMITTQLNGKELYEILNGIPIGKESLDNVQDFAKINIEAFDEKLLAALKAVPGYFVIRTKTENGKINVNGLARSEYKTTFKTALTRLFSDEQTTKFLEMKGVKAEDLVTNLTDYVSTSTFSDKDHADKSVPYEQLKFPHRAKNAPFDSLDELRRVPGFHDDEVFNVFSPYLTVWPMDAEKESIDINKASIELLASILTKEQQSANEAIFDKLEDMREDGLTITDLRDKTKYVPIQNDPAGKEVLSNLIGIESNVYKIEVEGYAEGIQRTFSCVLYRKKGGGSSTTPTSKPATPTDPTAPPPDDKTKASSPSSSDASSVRVLYQRFY